MSLLGRAGKLSDKANLRVSSALSSLLEAQPLLSSNSYIHRREVDPCCVDEIPSGDKKKSLLVHGQLV